MRLTRGLVLFKQILGRMARKKNYEKDFGHASRGGPLHKKILVGAGLKKKNLLGEKGESVG